MKIVIGTATRNKAGYLKMAMSHNLRMQKYLTLSEDAVWLVQDDASDDETPDVLKELQQCSSKIVVVRNEEQLGISQNKNALFEFARNEKADFMITVDDDVLLSYRWITSLLFRLYENPTAGIVSAFVANDPNMQAKLVDRDFTISGPTLIQVDGCGAACTAIRSELFGHEWRIPKINYGYEDADFHGEIQKQGWKIFVDTHVTAIHLPHVVWLNPEQEKAKLHSRHVFRGVEEEKFAESFERNYGKVLNKWIK